MKYGFIGAGNMASAIMKGMVKSKTYSASDLYAFDVNKPALTNLQTQISITPLESANEVIKHSDVVIFAVKPNVLVSVLEETKSEILAKKPLVISIAVGKTLAY